MKELTLIEKMILIVYFAGKRLVRLGNKILDILSNVVYFTGKRLARLRNKILDILSDIVYVHDCFICKLFKPYGRKFIFGIGCVIVFFFACGTAGSSDLNLITFSELTKQMVTETILLFYLFHNARI